jgi:hypothetical protein
LSESGPRRPRSRGLTAGARRSSPRRHHRTQSPPGKLGRCPTYVTCGCVRW